MLFKIFLHNVSIVMELSTIRFIVIAPASKHGGTIEN